MTNDVVIVFILLVSSFVVATMMTPVLTNFLYRHHLGKQIRDARETPIFSALHALKSGTPTMAGVLIWGTVVMFTLGGWLINRIWHGGLVSQLNFWSRSETYLPIGVLLLAALVGLLDDFYNVRRRGAHGGGLRVRHRLLMYTAIAVLGALWFTFKLNWTTLHLPFHGISMWDYGIYRFSCSSSWPRHFP